MALVQDDYGQWYDDNPPDYDPAGNPLDPTAPSTPPPPPVTQYPYGIDMTGDPARAQAIRDLYEKYGGRTNVPDDEIYGWYRMNVDIPWIEQRISNEWNSAGKPMHTQPATAPTAPAPTDPNLGGSPGGTGGTGTAAPQLNYSTPVPAGYDATKWADQNHNTPKYIAGRIIANGGTINDVVAALTAAGHQARIHGSSKDVIDYYDPSYGWVEVDIIRDVGGANAAQWGAQYDTNGTPESRAAAGMGGMDAQRAAGMIPTALSSMSGGGGGIPGFNQLMSDPNSVFSSMGQSAIPQYLDIIGKLNSPFQSTVQEDPRTTELYNLLMGKAQQGLAVDPNDPIIKAQVDAFRASQTRDMRDYLGGIAEQSGPYGNINTERRMVNEDLMQNVSGFQAELMGRELTARRQEISEALALGAGLLTDTQRLGLQRELGLIDAHLRQMGLIQQGSQFDRSLALDYLQTMLQNDQFYQGLSQQDKQFYASLLLQQLELEQNAFDLQNKWDFNWSGR